VGNHCIHMRGTKKCPFPCNTGPMMGPQIEGLWMSRKSVVEGQMGHLLLTWKNLQHLMIRLLGKKLGGNHR